MHDDLYEYRVYPIAMGKMGNPDHTKIEEQLNEFGADGWAVVASLNRQQGAAYALVLQRPKTQPG
jgi:hypothetical protein